MTFDPDKYLSDSEFDPDKYLMSKEESYDYSNLPSDLIKTNVDALPMYGAAAGSMFGPIGAGAGAAAGDSLKKTLYSVKELVTGERKIEDEFRLPTKEQLIDLVNSQMKAFNEGATAEMGGQVAGKVLQKAGGLVNKGFNAVAENIRPPVRKANSDQIIKAAKELGIDVTPGMLDDTGFVERLESALAKSPSFLGQSVAKDLQAVREGLQKAGQETLEGASNLSPYDLGEKFKTGITAEVGERLQPLSDTFNTVAEHTKNIPLSEKSLAAVQRNAGKLDVMQMGIGTGKAQQYIDAIPKLKNADQVKQLMTLLNDDLYAAQGAEKQVLGAIKDKLARLEENSIMRAAIQTARESGGAMKEASGKAVGSDIVSELQSARQGYRDLAQDLKTVAKEARVPSSGSPNQFLNAVEAVPSERIQSKFFNTENNRQLMALKEKFPEQFELLRTGKLGDISSGAIDNSLNGQGGFSTQKFLNEVRKLNPEAQQMLFGDKVSKVSNIEAVQKAMPRNFNPSGTASEMGWQDAIYKNVKDIPTYLLYKGAGSNLANKIGENLLKSPRMLELSQTNPKAFEQFVARLSQTGLEKLDEPRSKEPDKDHILKKTQGSKYSQVLQKAAEKGDSSFNAAHFVLSQRDPEYRKQMQDDK